MAHRRLYRSAEHRVIAGICGGIAEYFETDPALVRIIFVFLSLIGAGGLLLYIILWIMIPEKNGEHKKHAEFVHEVKSHMERSQRAAHGMLGLFIILIGALFLVDEFYPGLGFQRFWPVFIILFGALIMFRRHKE